MCVPSPINANLKSLPRKHTNAQAESGGDYASEDEPNKAEEKEEASSPARKNPPSKGKLPPLPPSPVSKGKGRAAAAAAAAAISKRSSSGRAAAPKEAATGSVPSGNTTTTNTSSGKKRNRSSEGGRSSLSAAGAMPAVDGEAGGGGGEGGGAAGGGSAAGDRPRAGGGGWSRTALLVSSRPPPRRWVAIGRSDDEVNIPLTPSPVTDQEFDEMVRSCVQNDAIERVKEQRGALVSRLHVGFIQGRGEGGGDIGVIRRWGGECCYLCTNGILVFSTETRWFPVS